jgi:hypothetical protein
MESSGIGLLCFQTSTLEGGDGSASRPGCFSPGKDPVPIVQEAGWDPGPVWTGAENLASTGIRYPDRPARSQSLCRQIPGPLRISALVLQAHRLSG